MNKLRGRFASTKKALWQGIALLCASALLNCGDGTGGGHERAGAAARNVGFETAIFQLSLSPSNPQIAQGTGQQFSVRGFDEKGHLRDLTAAAGWSVREESGHPLAIVPDAEGMLQLEMPGRYWVTADYAGQRMSTPITVTAATVKTIAVTPASPRVPKGATQQFTAIATFTDATTQDVTRLATWAVKDLTGAGVATIDTTGLLTAKQLGRATISARYKTSSASTSVEVTPASLTALLVSPADPTIANGTAIRFTASGVFSDGSSMDLSRSVAWAITDFTGTRVASIDGTGLANGLSLGTATVSAEYMGLTAETTLTVGAALPASLSISPANAMIAKGMIQRYTATATLTDGSIQDVTTLAAWTAVDRMGVGVASIDASGEARGNAIGSATISASYLGHSASTVLEVSAAVLTSLRVIPASATLLKGQYLSLAATGVYSDGSTQDLSATAVWTTADLSGTDVASVSSTGRMFGKNQGKARLTATVGGFSASADVEVKLPAYTSLALSGLPFVLRGFPISIKATATLADGSMRDVTRLTTWKASDVLGIGVATIDSSGILTGTSAGLTEVKGTFDGLTATLRIPVFEVDSRK